jgi:Gas vesicle synthesis protein GvpL/GvpF
LGSLRKQVNLMSNENEEGRYIYGIMAANHRQEFGPIGIGERGDVVYTLPYQDAAAIVSQSPITKYPVTRDNTIAHTKVLEKAVEEATVLPARFCTIAPNDEVIVEKVLKPRYQEFIGLLREMEGKVELGVRALWPDMNTIYSEIVEENKEIKELKESLLKEKDEQKKQAGKVKIGQMVQDVLEEKRKREAGELLDALRPLSLDYKERQIYGDMNIESAAFLVAKEKESDFDHKVDELDAMYGQRKRIKYTADIVPYNFVEIVIKW